MSIQKQPSEKTWTIEKLPESDFHTIGDFIETCFQIDYNFNSN